MKRIACVLAVSLIAGLGGCASNEDAEQMMPNGIVNVLGPDPKELQAPADGQVSVYDVNTANLVYAGIIKKGQMFVINRANRQITIDGVVANKEPLRGGDSLQIKYDRNN